MKKILMVPCLALLLLAGACQSHMEYDLSDDRLDKEATLFEQGLPIPVGSAGPFTLELVTKTLSGYVSKLGLPADILSVEEDGKLLMKTQTEIANVNLYQLAMEKGDNAEAWVWEPGDKSGSASIGFILNLLGISMHNQSFTLEASSPLSARVPMSGTASLKCTATGKEDWQQDVTLKDVNLPSYGTRYELASFKVPETYTLGSASVLLTGPKITLPAHYGKKVTGDGKFICYLTHKTNISVGEKFSLPIPLNLNVNIPLGKLNLREATVGVALESTVPMQLSVKEIKALDAEDKVNENLAITPNVQLAGGSPEAPVTSKISLNIKSLDGRAIPDIQRISIQLQAAAAPGYTDVVLSSKQGVSVKHSSITISGGVTLFSHEK